MFLIFLIISICMDYLIYSDVRIIKNLILAASVSLVMEFLEIKRKKARNKNYQSTKIDNSIQ